MSEELGVRSEELVRSLRSCADCCGKCSECAYERHEDCAGDMKRDAADEIERLTAEREALLLAASGRVELCDTCKFGPDSGKPCVEDVTLDCLHGCSGCPCAKCSGGSEWVWNEKGE